MPKMYRSPELVKSIRAASKELLRHGSVLSPEGTPKENTIEMIVATVLLHITYGDEVTNDPSKQRTDSGS